MADDPRNEAVGYKRPPRQTRFRPGQSGNPSGRPKGTRNLATDLGEELAERIAIREGDRRHRGSKQRALVKAMVSKALKGDTRAAAIVLQLAERVVTPEMVRAGTAGGDLPEDDRAILERFVARQFSTHK